MQTYENKQFPLIQSEGDFTNRQIEVETIPDANLLIYQPLEKPLLYVMLIGRFVTLGFMALGALMLALSNGWWLKLVFWGIYFASLLLLAISIFVFNKFAFRKKGYALREKDIIYKTGLLWKKWIAIPFNRIQHCEIRKGPVEDFFEICKLRIYTAGGSGSDLSIPGLPMERATRLKDFIMNKAVIDEEE